VTANIRTVRRDHSVYHAVQVAASDKPERTTTFQMRGHFKKAGVSPKRIVKEFPVTPDALVPVGRSSIIQTDLHCFMYIGTTLSAIHFVPGQYVDVSANRCAQSPCSSIYVAHSPKVSGKVSRVG